MKISDLDALAEESIKRGIPIIGREKGAWLLKKVREIKPQKILELGTANGYSGIILGSTGAELVTIESNPRIIPEAEQNFRKWNINATVVFGDGVHEIKKCISPVDLIFLDFYKLGYIQVLDDCLRLLPLGGYLIADNINFKECKKFKQKILHHPLLQTEIIDIKDGLSCSRKIG